jgi:hypothetical protein
MRHYWELYIWFCVFSVSINLAANYVASVFKLIFRKDLEDEIEHKLEDL